MDLMRRINSAAPCAGQICLAWLGSAGFLIKNSHGKILAVDPYLSHRSERLDGNKRLTPPVVEADELRANLYLASHFHSDHLDLDSLPSLMSDGALLYCCTDSYELCRTEPGIDINRVIPLKTGDCFSSCGFEVEAVFADHGDSAPAALGFVIETEGIRIYFTGDTSYQSDRMSYISNKNIDILIPPINGEYGNMNERDAAMLAAQVKAKLTIPCHFWTFARHQGRPFDFQTSMLAIAPDCPLYLMAQGELIYFPANL